MLLVPFNLCDTYGLHSSEIYTPFTLYKTTVRTVWYGSAWLLICCVNANRTELNRASLTVLGPPTFAMPARLNIGAVMVSIQ